MRRGREFSLIAVCTVAAMLGGCHPGPGATFVYVNSYHPGNVSSDAIMAGMYEVIADSRARLDVFFLDTKRFPEPEAIATRTQEVLAAIRKARPDVIIASGDNAVKSVIAEHFRDGPIPCVFCGVNWTCQPYGLPTDNVTGMLDVPPVLEAVEKLRQDHPDMKNLVVLSANATSRRRNEAGLTSAFSQAGLDVTYALVETFDEWKQQFIRANRDADVVFLPTHEAVQDWDDVEAQAFVHERLRVPVFTCNGSMMKYAVFGLTSVAQEQGQWAALTALRIARGRSPAEIPVAQNQQTVAYINVGLADRIDWQPDAELRSRSNLIE